MNIAIIDHVGAKAGMDYYSSSLASGFLHQNCEVCVYSNFVGINSSDIHYYPYFEGHSNGNPALKFVKFIIATIKASYSARKHNSNLVIFHLFSAVPIMLLFIIIPKLFGLKVAVISHDVSSFTDNDNTIVQNLIYNTLSDFIIVHNQFSYDTLLENMHIENPNKVAIIKHGGYLDHIGEPLNKIDIRHELGLDPLGKYMLFFGQIKDVKGLDVLLEAMSKVTEDIKLIIAGKPWRNDFSLYDQQIKKLGLNSRIIKMIRFIEDDEREKLFFSADVNILPYRIIFQSGVLLMAMSHGLPVIASDLPANKEIINDEDHGILFTSEDSNSLAQKIEMFFNDSILQEKLATNALNTIKDEYNWDQIASNYLKMLSGKMI
jgi:glycosyltransferase involved in cell wall biosynthesis